MTTQHSLQDELQHHLIQTYLKGNAPEGFDSQFDLIESGIITSLALISLLNHIENQYDIEIGEEDIVPENFETIQAIEQLIHDRLAQS